MTNKKRLSGLLTALLAWLCLTLSIFSFSAFAEEEEAPLPTLTSNAVQVTAGSSVTVYLRVENFVSVGAVDLYAFYDPDVMTLTSSSKQTIANSAQVSINTDTPGEACFSAISTTGMSGNGNIWCLSFRINNNAEAGIYYVNFAVGNAYDILLEPVSINATSCAITVNRPTSTVTPQKISINASYANKKYTSGDTFNVKLYTSSAKGMASGEFVITYDPYMLSPTSVKLGSKLTSANGAIWSVNDKTPGYIKISYAALTGVTGNVNPMVDIDFEVIGSVAEDTVSSIRMELTHPYDSLLNTMTGSNTTANISLAAPPEIIVLPEITLENAVLTGDTLSIDVIAPGTTGLAAGDFVLTYDRTLLECVTFDCPGDGCMLIGNIKESEGKLVFSFIFEDGIDSDTVIASVKFRISGCTDRSPAFSITGKNLVTSTYESISVSYRSKLSSIDLSHRLISFDAKSPTCVLEGWNAYVSCERCGYSTMVGIPATGHTPGTMADCSHDQLCVTCFEVLTSKLGHDHVTEWTVDLEPTCTEIGSKSRHCTRCDDKTDVTEIPAKGHSHMTVVTAPTCTEKGYTTHTCSRCNDSYIDSEVNALGHKPGAEADCLNDQVCTVCGAVLKNKLGHNYNAVVTDPTCTENGYTTHTCSRCSDTYTDSKVDALGHKPGDEADCLNDQTCTVCGTILVGKSGHNYVAVVTAPSCTEKGYTTHTCSRCDDSYIDSEVDALGHKPGTEADCLNDQTCTVCGAILTEKLGHDYVAVAIKPTCTEKGYTTHTCSRCGDTYIESEVDALGHKPGTEADCLNDQTCTVCGEVLKDKLGHNYNAVVTAPTCTEQGYTTHTCSRCDDSYIDSEVEALGHKPGAEADCLNDQVCTVCGEVLVDKLGHDYVAVVTAPSCIEMGYTTHTCSRCDDSYIDSEVAELGHTPSEWIIDVEPAPGIEGGKHIECTICGEKLETDVIEALPVQTETNAESKTETESAVTSETSESTEKAPAQNGCSGNIYGGISLLALMLSVLLLTVRRKKETE